MKLHIFCSNDFWENIKRICEKEGRSWADLASATGLSAQSMASARHLDSRIRLGTLIRLCQVLDRRPEDLLYPAMIHDKERGLTCRNREKAEVKAMLPHLDKDELKEFEEFIRHMTHRMYNASN